MDPIGNRRVKKIQLFFLPLNKGHPTVTYTEQEFS